MFGSRNFLFAKSAVAGAVNKLFSWGSNTYGQLGLGNTTSYSSPKQVGALITWNYPTIVGTTNSSVLCNKTDGTLWSWGNGSNGVLGTGNEISRSSPVQVGALTTWGRPSAIQSYSGACVKTDGTLWTWGYNSSGQLGLGNTTSYSSPKQVGSLANWSKLTRSSFVASLLCTKTDGTLWAWGANAYGQLGLGDITDRSSPTQVGALTTWSNPAMGRGQSLCTKTDGTLWTWGRGLLGALGIGNTTNYSSPVQVGALTNWSKPSGGNFSSACVKTDGTLWMWGYNGFGQLGLGNTTTYSSPKQIAGVDWAYVKAGWNVSVGVKTDGTLFTWGRNDSGQLGLGNTTNYSSPKQIAGTNWKNPTVSRTTMLCTTT